MSVIEPTPSVPTANVDMIDPNVPVAAVLAFEARLRGDLVRRGDAAYDDARALYNAMIDKRPWLIARCADVADVVATVAFARDHDLRLAVRGGGHNGGGLGSVDDGVLLDLAALNGVRIDAESRTARVEGGATWARSTMRRMRSVWRSPAASSRPRAWAA